jgi:1-acyl-sn-glycerol-3-phosphate acyltransferase
MGFVRGLIYRLFFYGLSVPLALAGALVAPFSAEAVRAVAHWWARWFVWCARAMLDVRLEVRGTIPQRDAIVAFKHQSAYETILTLFLFHHPAVVMKAELRRIPVWGFVSARHGSIFVERGKAGVALKGMIRDARARIAAGRPVVIFPEGTRVAPGTQPPVKAGLYALYSVLDVPVVPVALDAGAVWPKGWAKGPGTVTLAFGPDIPPGLSREAVEARTHAAINADPLTAAVR